MQEVSISLQDRDLSFNCSYAENSTAQGCQVTMCQSIEGQVVPSVCGTFTSRLTSPIGPIRVSIVGNYVVTSVADIEEDGSINIVENIAVFGTLETSPFGTLPSGTLPSGTLETSPSDTSSVPATGSSMSSETTTLVSAIAGELYTGANSCWLIKLHYL